MAASLTYSTSTLSELWFLNSETRYSKLRIPLSRFQSRNSRSSKLGLKIRLGATKEDRGVIVKEEEEKRNGVFLNGNGSSGYGYKGLSENSNGSASVILNGNGVSNGSLVKYVNGNGSVREVVEEESAESKKGEKRKMNVEDIGQEEAWFKRGGRNKVEVSVTPGGRWNRFKTYSTIQRTLEIWGSVLTFIVKVWLTNQKFTYRGKSPLS